MARGSPSSRRADLGHPPRLLGGQAEVRPDLAGPLQEQGHRRRARQLLRRCVPRRLGHRQRRHRELLLAVHVQARPAGGQDTDVRAGPQNGGRQLPARGQDVLAVVQEQQEAPGGQRGGQGGHNVLAGLLPYPQRGGDGVGDQTGFGQRGQLHDPGPVGVVLEQVGPGLERQPGLADPGRPGERDQPVVLQEARRRAHVRLPPDQAVRLQGQVVGPAFERAQGGERFRQVRVRELEQVLRPLQVAQPVDPQVAQGGAGGQGVPRQDGGGRREEHLAPVAGGREAGAAVQGLPEVVPALHVHLPGVQPHPYPERARFAPGLGPERDLPRQGGGHRVPRAGERRVDGIPHRLEHHPLVALHRLPQEGVVAGGGLPVGGRVGRQQAGAALQVGEQERHRPRRQRRQRACPEPPGQHLSHRPAPRPAPQESMQQGPPGRSNPRDSAARRPAIAGGDAAGHRQRFRYSA